MKRLLLIVLPLLLIVGCSKEPINYEETLNERDGVFYTKDTNKPYSGSVFSLDDKGRNKIESNLEDGKMINYMEMTWYENGQKKFEKFYKNEDGKQVSIPVGIWKYWDKEGNEYKGKAIIVSKDTDVTSLDGGIFGIQDGGKFGYVNFINGKVDGKFFEWGKDDILVEDGVYKDGKLISTSHSPSTSIVNKEASPPHSP